MEEAADAVGAVSRRDRVRAATTEEIKQVARKILVDEGPEAVTLRAIAREMGMTAPALYRYFGSHQDLIRNVCGDIFLEIGGDIQAAIDAAAPRGIAAKFGAAAREFRQWSLGHEREFGLLFGTPVPGFELKEIDIADECGRKFADTFLGLFLELWLKKPFAVRAPEEIDPGLLEQLERYRDAMGTALPVGAILSFVYCWTRLYGMVSLEVFGHLSWILDDGEPMFEMMLKEIMPVLGLTYPSQEPA
ncbi:MAG TPA: TetR/AcrR family transcriptional regulator [Streptosporangiaceae bacterium]|nr:TetR/AcrR family transcriptional regulator [Streptosporangiaceae bacterium]